MKKVFSTLLLTAVLVLSFATANSFAQKKDTLVVHALPPGNLNTVINADTTAGGESKHIYLLAPNGAVDTTYFIKEEIRIKNLKLIGKINPKTGHLPVIAPFIRDE